MMKKGYVLSLDALLALTLVMIIFFMVLEMQGTMSGSEDTEFKEIHYVSEDVMEVMSKKGVLDQICTEWALAGGNTSSYHWTNARDIARIYLSDMVPDRMGYALLINGSDVCNDTSGLSMNDSKIWTHSERILTGYQSGMPTQAYVSRVSINSTNVSYGSVYKEPDGCNWTIKFWDDTKTSMRLPSSYTGVSKCNYTNDSIDYDNQSAPDDAAYRLFSKLDVSPHDHKIDNPLKFSADDVVIDMAVVGNVRSMWGPVSVELVMWLKK
jgi:hypothetical protein